MLIDLNKLDRDELKLEYLYNIGELDLADDNITLAAPCKLTLSLQRRSQDIDVHGSLKTKLSASCNRCLAAFEIPIESSFYSIYLPLDKLNKTDEMVLERQELDFSFYSDDSIDVDEMLSEQIQLALPMSQLCQPDCQGLCGSCGTDLNKGKCQCTSQMGDPRWSALLDIKKKIK